MRMKQVGNKRDLLAVVIHNADTVTIPLGAPVCLALNATNDGLDVILPSTAEGVAANSSLYTLYGVALGAIPVSGYGEAQVFGFCADLLYTLETRASTTASWSTASTAPAFTPLTFETKGNGWQTYAVQSFVTGATTATTTMIGFQPMALLAQTLQTVSASASTTADTRTVLTTLVKAYVHIL